MVRARRDAKDSLWVEPVELTNGPAMLVYRASNRWAYSGAAQNQVDLDIVGRAIRSRGWLVDRVAIPGRIDGGALTPP